MSRLRFLLLSFCLLVINVEASTQRSLPDELYRGLIEFELNSGHYFKALVLMDDQYKRENPINHAKALWGFHVTEDANEIIAKKPKSELSPQQQFVVGEVYYEQDDCVNALKSFKGLKNQLSLDDKQKYIFYAANCFIKLGSDTRAAKVLRDILSGTWAAYAYYNLAISYAEGSRDKTKALAALGIAASLNENKNKRDKALSDRINLAAAALYLEEDKQQAAINFLKKVHLDSDSSAHALYLNGLANLELGDFRSANQSWVASKKYSLVNTSAAESLLAIPYAFERSGYTSQALEAYLDASSSFENELKLIKKLDDAIERYGVQKVLIEADEIKGLEWFLANDIALNTTRAAYYSYLVADTEVYDRVELHSELSLLKQSLDYWKGQLQVFNTALKSKQSNFSRNKKSLDTQRIKQQINQYKQKLSGISSSSELSSSLKKSIELDAMSEGLDVISERLSGLSDRVARGKQSLDQNVSTNTRLLKEIARQSKRVEKLMSENDKHLTELVSVKLEELRVQMVSNYERAEQGLIHIFQSIAENKNRSKRKGQR